MSTLIDIVTILLVWFLISIPLALVISWGLSRARRDAPFSSREAKPETVVQVDFVGAREAEEKRAQEEHIPPATREVES